MKGNFFTNENLDENSNKYKMSSNKTRKDISQLIFHSGMKNKINESLDYKSLDSNKSAKEVSSNLKEDIKESNFRSNKIENSSMNEINKSKLTQIEISCFSPELLLSVIKDCRRNGIITNSYYEKGSTWAIVKFLTSADAYKAKSFFESDSFYISQGLKVKFNELDINSFHNRQEREEKSTDKAVIRPVKSYFSTFLSMLFSW